MAILSRKEIAYICAFLGCLSFLFSIITIWNIFTQIDKNNNAYSSIQIEDKYDNIIQKISKNEVIEYTTYTLLPKDTNILKILITTSDNIIYKKFFIFKTLDNKLYAYRFPFTEKQDINMFNTNANESEKYKNKLYNIKYGEPIKVSIGVTLYDIFNTVTFFSGMVMFFVFVQMVIGEVVSGKNFKPNNVDLDINFDDVIGYNSVKKEFQQIIQYIKNKKQYDIDEINVPKGILLTGDPGVGKTMFAKAFANEIKANIYFASGADFAELYVGVGAKRVRNLFRSARMNSPSVIFIDEFDAIGSREGMNNDTERLSVINQLLTEMDGLSRKGDFFVIATTNHEEKIDPAILRPGRIDRKINIPTPDSDTRRGIIQKYLGQQYTIDNEDLERLVIKTQNYSGAMLKNLIENAKITALKEFNTKHISKKIIEDVQEDLLIGLKQNIVLNKEQKERIAFHELGHAFISHKLLPNEIVNKITIEPRGKALGYTLTLPIEEVYLYTKEELLNKVTMLLAGRAAEEIFIGNVTNGCYDDLQKANQIVHEMIEHWGMSEKNPLVVKIKSDQLYQVSNNIEKDKEVSEILSKQYNLAKNILNENKIIIALMSKKLIDKGMLSEEDFNQFNSF